MPHRSNRLSSIQQLLSNNSTTSRSLVQGSNGQGVLGASEPPLITDTLTACLDVNGTYVCTSYSPRCYIIQKVTPNSVTVTPSQVTNYAAQNASLGGGGVSLTNSSFDPPTFPPVLRPFSYLHTPNPNGSRQPKIHGRQHHAINIPPTSTSSAAAAAMQVASSSSTSMAGTSSLTQPRTPTQFEKPAALFTGGVLMNGDIACSIGSVGESGMPSMVFQQPVSAALSTHGSQLSDPHAGSMNGTIMTQEPYSVGTEMPEIDTGESTGNGSVGSEITQNPSSDMPIDKLKKSLLEQLEYYFSPTNLAMDKFLVSQMDSDHYVYISTLADFNLVKKLTSDVDLITEVLRESKNLQVHADGKRVRPISQRTVVILRGIPQSTSAEEIKMLFENENCPKCTGCEFAGNDSWYVSFESDDDARSAHRYIREDVKEFKGQPIMARIKSRPTALLNQGIAIGVPNIKNGYNHAGAVIPPYLATGPPFVPPNQPTGGTSNAPTPIYAPGQQMSNVFTVPNYGGFTPWPSYYDMNPGGLTSFMPVNGLPHSGPGYSKTAQPNQRPPRINSSARNSGLRRQVSSTSDTQSNVGTGASGSGSSGHSLHQLQSYGSQSHRKNGTSPAPLLGMPPTLTSHPPPNHNHHHQGHHVPHNSISQTNSNHSSSTRHFSNYTQTLPHNPSSENYHYGGPGTNRPYRGGGDSRPRSSLSRRGPRRDMEADGAYDYHPASTPAMNYRGNPSTRVAPPPTGSPQISAPVPVNNQNHQIDLDLEGAFPPLPGSANSMKGNGDSPYEGRLADVVRGVKNTKISINEKEDEIVVSAAEAEDIPPGEVVVSAASPTKEEEATDSRTSDRNSSQNRTGGKKEFREVGVGGADETYDIHSSQSRNSVSNGLRQTADKSTGTDKNLLNGDQTGGSSNKPNLQVNSRKSNVTQTATVGGNKSPVAGKRAAAAPFQPSSGGTEVPYTNTSSNKGSNPTASTQSTSKPGNSVPNTSGSNIGQLGRGANNSNINVAKAFSSDNNRSSIVSKGAGPNNAMSAPEKDTSPAQSVKSVPSPTTGKPFSGLTDHIVKDNSKGDCEHKESGQGDSQAKNNDCSIDDRDCPVRLSYAQVAQTRKENAAAAVQLQSSTSTLNVSSQAEHSASITSNVGNSSLPVDERQRGSKDRDFRDSRPPPKRGPIDRDRGFRRGGYRNRMGPDNIDTMSNAGNTRYPPPKGRRSPK